MNAAGRPTLHVTRTASGRLWWELRGGSESWRRSLDRAIAAWLRRRARVRTMTYRVGSVRRRGTVEGETVEVRVVGELEARYDAWMFDRLEQPELPLGE